MKVSVWDTYVDRTDGKVMHFDILVPQSLQDADKVFEFGKEYLTSKPFETGKLSAEECQFCHVEQASEDVIKDIEDKGYHIIEMEYCT